MNKRDKKRESKIIYVIRVYAFIKGIGKIRDTCHVIGKAVVKQWQPLVWTGFNTI